MARSYSDRQTKEDAEERGETTQISALSDVSEADTVQQPGGRQGAPLGPRRVEVQPGEEAAAGASL